MNCATAKNNTIIAVSVDRPFSMKSGMSDESRIEPMDRP